MAGCEEKFGSDDEKVEFFLWADAILFGAEPTDS